MIKFLICSTDMPEELNEKQLEIVMSGSFSITNIAQKGNKWHCNIFGF